jgi:hypothetical protein
MPVLAVAVVGLVACGVPTKGIATPAVKASGGSGAPTSEAPASTSASPLASIQPCKLLSQAVLDQLQVRFTKSGEDSARYCDYQKLVDENGNNGWAIGVDIRDDQSLDSVNTGGYTVTSNPIGSHQAKELTAMPDIRGNCITVIGVGPTARVDLTANATTDTQQACQVVRIMAQAVEPELPGGN